MLIFNAFKDLRIRRLWIGQVGSSVGDELYRMAFIWLAVELLGADTGHAKFDSDAHQGCITFAGSQWFDEHDLSFGQGCRPGIDRVAFRLGSRLSFFFRSIR